MACRFVFGLVTNLCLQSQGNEFHLNFCHQIQITNLIPKLKLNERYIKKIIIIIIINQTLETTMWGYNHPYLSLFCYYYKIELRRE